MHTNSLSNSYSRDTHYRQLHLTLHVMEEDNRTSTSLGEYTPKQTVCVCCVVWCVGCVCVCVCVCVCMR